MNRIEVSGIMLTLLLIGMLTLAFDIQPVKAELPVPQLSVVPSETVVSVGQVFDVNVVISDLDIRWELVGVSFKLGYNNSRLEALNATEGPFMRKFIQPCEDPSVPPGDTFFIFFIEEDYVLAGVILLNPPTGKWCPVFPEGNGTLVTVMFRALETGNSLLHLFDTELSDEDANQIPHTTVEGYIEVREPILGDLNLDSRVDMKDIAMAALAFGSYAHHPRWDPNADINNDGKVDMRDIVVIARNFGKKYS